MTKHFGWLGLVIGLAFVPSACGGDDGDDDTGTGGTGNAPAAGKGGASAGKGGASGKSGGGGTSNGGKAGKGGRGGTGGSGNASGADSVAGSGGDDSPAGGTSGTGGTSAAGAGGESAASGQAGQAGNGGEGGEAPLEPIEIAGTWENTDFGQTDVIDADSWAQDYGTGPTVSAIVKFSNSENFAIRQAPHDALYDPDKFDRTVWTEVDGGVFYYCTIDHGVDTAEDAEARTTAYDASDVDGIGCDGFPWTKMTAP